MSGLQDATEFAFRATNFDSQGMFDAAIYYYKAAADALNALRQQGSQIPGLADKVNEYTNRSRELEKLKEKGSQKEADKNEQQLQLERAEFLFSQALDEDEANNADEAIRLYSDAVELCLQARNASTDQSLKAKLTKLAEHALDRAEVLKVKNEDKPVARKPDLPSASNVSDDFVCPPRSEETQLKQVPKGQLYTPEEISVLRVSSKINRRDYVPFMTCDLAERFAYPLPFQDGDGFLALSKKQKSAFSKWMRPEMLSSSPKIFQFCDYSNIKQTIVSDCSFIASLAVCSLYEKRFNKNLLSSIMYPRNRAGQPVYNPCGKYMIKFNINGVPRKVIIDDFLPVDYNRKLLCSYSNNSDEFGISLLEKAYMKVMGGYDFPGSNSSIDLNALTGWIPERISMEESNFSKETTFSMLMSHHRDGSVLLTLATGPLDEREAERTGLIPTHAYALLDIREVLGKKLLLLKNPWSHVRWKGKFSEQDLKNWTGELRAALKYDPRNAQMFDNGIFWIDYSSVCHFFSVIYLNWNPKMFPYTSCIHECWRAGHGPTRDCYNISENPQYVLQVKSKASVWLLLTRHITERDDFAENKEYIALVIYKNNGRKIYFPYDPEPYIDGVRINSPHYLCKLSVTEGSVTNYTIVVSQYEKSNTIYYTLRVYSTCPFSLNRIKNSFKYKHEVKNSNWTERNAGGCPNFLTTYHLNPVFQVTLDSSSDDNGLLIDLKGPKQYQVGFEITTVHIKNSSCPTSFNKKMTEPFRSGFNVLELLHVPAGTYNVTPCTFHPKQQGPFFLTVQSTCPLSVKQIK